MTLADTADLAHAWADALIDQLVSSGVSHFFIAPGSRSTPLAMAAARHARAETLVHFDERGTAFMALGAARAMGHPAAWITTSGTALANGFPAIVEASIDSIPMILLTADRPPELRHTGANQTIDQVKLFGDYVRWFFDFPVPDDRLSSDFVRSTAAHAIARASGVDPGPVHLNCMFREPLSPDRSYEPRAAGDTRPFMTFPPRLMGSPEAVERVREVMAAAERPVIVAGRMNNRDDPGAIARLAERLGWPLIADIQSQLRLGTDAGANRLDHFDPLLAAGVEHPEPPDLVLHFGAALVSKRIAQWLADSESARRVSIRGESSRLDPSHQIGTRIQATPGAFASQLLEHPAGYPPHPHLQQWMEMTAHVRGRIADVLLRQVTLSEPAVAHHLTTLVPESHVLVAGSSMPIRDLDMFAAADGAAISVIANRGASGIDGTVATAVGVAEAARRPVTLLCGDLTLLHDLNSLAAAAKSRHPIIIIVINNDGGGIFSFLPVARHREVFEPYFGTPHGLRFRDAASMFGLAYEAPPDIPAFRSAYESAARGSTSAVIELITDRADNRDQHQRLYDMLAGQ